MPPSPLLFGVFGPVNPEKVEKCGFSAGVLQFHVEHVELVPQGPGQLPELP
jgi:hypothetical protein